MLRASLKASVAGLLQGSGYFDQNAVLVSDFQYKKLPDIIGKALVFSTTNPEQVMRWLKARREVYTIMVVASLRLRSHADTSLTDLADGFKIWFNTTFDNNRDTLWNAFGGNALVLSDGFNRVNVGFMETEYPDSQNVIVTASIDIDVTRKLD